MIIPKHEEIRVPALDLLTEMATLKLKEFEQPLADKMNLGEEEVAEEYASGNGRIFYDRISWALSYMNMAGLVQKPKRGTYQITDLGREYLSNPENIHTFIAEQVANREPQKRSTPDHPPTPITGLTPQEELYESSSRIRTSVYSEIIDVILSKTPREFEELVVMLLQHMGYGGTVKAAGEVTKYSNDGGIDGIIKEDVLGLGRIHIQAKRYARGNTISREEVQKFVGALAVAQSNKGVFITTSSYSRGAVEYAENLNGATNVVLIDGDKLAEYIYEYGLGMQVEEVIEIKKLDSDFWDEMDDDAALSRSEH
jgi:restriction system protein